MSVDVYVVLRRNSELGDDILKKFWSAAVKVFKEYGIETYVIPLITNEKGRDVTVIINGFEVRVNGLISVEDAVDLILTYIAVKNEASPTYALGVYIERDDSLSDASAI